MHMDGEVFGENGRAEGFAVVAANSGAWQGGPGINASRAASGIGTRH